MEGGFALRIGAIVCLAAGLASHSLAAQQPVVILEHRFRSDTDTASIVLRRRVVYKAELTGAGTLVVETSQKQPRAAFLVPVGDTTAVTRRFELYAVQDGPHRIRVLDVQPGDSVFLRILRDTVETERIAKKLDLEATLGLSVAGGVHSGYRLDPTGGENPSGGSDLEACLLLEVLNRAGTCVGASKQSFPDAGYSATWIFVEEQVRLVSHQFLGTRNTDLGVAIRYGKGTSVGPRHLDPDMLALGVHVAQHLSSEGRRHGWRVYLAWDHGRLGDAPETEFLETDRLTVGLIWAP